MATGLSLHLGLNTYDSTHYPGLTPLLGAERDAGTMAHVAATQGFTPKLLLAAEATFAAVRAEIATAATRLATGDTFLLTFAGHGSTVPDQNGDEPTGSDQTLCLYDQMIVDDKLHEDLGAFRAGVRIVVVADSCHSGTVLRDLFYEELRASPALKAIVGDGAARALPGAIASSVYLAHQAAYDAQQTVANKDAADKVQASVILLAACQDLQEAKDGPVHGKFTTGFLGVWNGGKYLQSAAPSYVDFLAKVGQAVADPSQVPNLYLTGAPDPTLSKRRPFVI